MTTPPNTKAGKRLMVTVARASSTGGILCIGYAAYLTHPTLCILYVGLLLNVYAAALLREVSK